MPPGATMPHDPDAVAIHQSRRAQIVNRRFVPVHPHLRFIERMRRAARWRGADLQHCDALVRQGLRQIHRPARPQRRADRATRSEEHTSELQSLMRISYAVFSLKNKTKKNILEPN